MLPGLPSGGWFNILDPVLTKILGTPLVKAVVGLDTSLETLISPLKVSAVSSTSWLLHVVHTLPTQLSAVILLIIFMKKFLYSDWQRGLQFQDTVICT